MNRDILHLGCGDDYREDALNIDAVESVNPDIVHDLDETPWPVETNAYREVIANHVLEHLTDTDVALSEIQRVLRPGGRAVVRVPIGVDARADPTHKHEWTWRTPEFYTGKRHWDSDICLWVVSREIRLWTHYPGLIGRLHQFMINSLIQTYEPGPWAFSLEATSGEFTVTFLNPGLKR